MLDIGDTCLISKLFLSQKVLTLGSFSDKKLVLFYPKDMTPGCTIESCNFNDKYSEIIDLAEAAGVSKDSQKSHNSLKKVWFLSMIFL